MKQVKGDGRLKHGKKLLRWMKELLEAKGLNPDNWLFVKNTPNELVIVHRHSMKPRTIYIGEGKI